MVYLFAGLMIAILVFNWIVSWLPLLLVGVVLFTIVRGSTR